MGRGVHTIQALEQMCHGKSWGGFCQSWRKEIDLKLIYFITSVHYILMIIKVEKCVTYHYLKVLRLGIKDTKNGLSAGLFPDPLGSLQRWINGKWKEIGVM